MYECAAWLTLLLLAQSFFGNLYEAVAFVPNAMSLIELKSRRGEALFQTKRASPAAYYTSPGVLALVLLLALAINGLFQHKPGTPYVLAACVLFLVAGGLTFYAVRYINLDLFFKPQSDLARARKLLDTWTMLNYTRLTIVGASLLVIILWLRIIIKS
jgi:hypothetical protein